MLSIYLFGYYGCGNAGDELLLSVVTEHLLRSAKVGEIKIKCLVPPEDSPDPRVSYDACEQILLDQKRSRPARFASYLHHIWRSLKGIDCCIFGGGTLFHATDGSKVNLVILASVVALARVRGAQIFALGVGVGKLQGFWPKVLMSLILLLCRDVAVRDETSRRNCARLFGSGKVRCTADLVFASEMSAVSARPPNRWNLGFSVAASALQKASHARLVSETTTALCALDRAGWSVTLLSLQDLVWQDLRIRDSDLLDSIVREGLVSKTNAASLTADKNRLGRVFDELDVLVGMRFHALVLAAMNGVPFVGFGEDSKLRDLCEAYGFPFIALGQFDAGKFVEAVGKVASLVPDKKVTERISRAAKANFDILDDAIL